MEKSAANIKIDDQTNDDPNHYNLALGIVLTVLAIALGVVLSFYLFFPAKVTKEVQYPKFRLIYASSSLLTVTCIAPPSVLDNPDNWKLTFLVENPTNDYNFLYDEFDAKITYKDTVLWQADNSARFYQDESAQNFVDATFGALPDSYNEWMTNTIMNDVASGLSTRFSVNLNGKVQISHHEEAQRNCGKLQVSCEDLEIKFSGGFSIGMLTATSDACAVHLQKSSC
ncbi:hypothetical protein A4A49_23125 [Nicotiana attenuata]|uniref:Late embryogenesis abundant protein LEA-2 subgroup domain-containing protein n=1 Tax=Nicotiana attenuata TaxID=49451 RepID=A0A1J6I624_NICAT|nr:hypothetical protein A4A49_23125 [Nicotiana attenuata]